MNGVQRGVAHIPHHAANAYMPRRRGVYSLVQLTLAGLLHVGGSCARPLSVRLGLILNSNAHSVPASSSTLWIYLTVAMFLVLLGGAFAGLTIALMGQDEMYLQVIATSGEGSEKKTAARVLRLLKRGKHWVLVTLLVGNVITNETLPIVLDRSIGGGYAAVISSTVLVIVFGEIVPQSICVRFGLPIGAWSSPFVLALMWVFAPVSWPIAKLLDYLLGEDHGTTYKKAGLKTLVTLHKTMGDGERLNEDEVSIISGVLDLKAKSVGSIMTPMNDVFTLSADAILDEEMMNDIMREGYSRIPIYEPNNRNDFVGMLLVKMLITYDPEDARRVSHFSLATLPETRPETSCLDILNFFQEGKSHMVLVSDFPGKSYGAIGVVTLEDVIEELIGEEIIDESDVFVDVHKAIRRMHAAPTHRARITKGEVVMDSANNQATAEEDLIDITRQSKENGENQEKNESPVPGKKASVASMDASKSPKPTTFLMRRKSSTSGGTNLVRPVQLRQHTFEMRQQLKNLGPSNSARQPKTTRVNTVTIKPGIGTIPEVLTSTGLAERSTVSTPPPTVAQGGIGQDLVSPGKQASDGVIAVQQGYGTWDFGGPWKSHSESQSNQESTERGAQTDFGSDLPEGSPDNGRSRSKIVIERNYSHSTLGSMHSPSPNGRGDRSRRRSTANARSGSITENYVESGAVKKLVLETTSSSGEETEEIAVSAGSTLISIVSRQPSHTEEDDQKDGANAQSPKKSSKHKKKGKKNKGSDGDENTPLISQD